MTILSPKQTVGFTLLELLAVVAVLSILALMGTKVYLGAKVLVEVTKAKSDLIHVGRAVNMYFLDHNALPPKRRPNWVVGMNTNYVRYMHELTTPISYINDLPVSPWDNIKKVYIRNNMDEAERVRFLQRTGRLPTESWNVTPDYEYYGWAEPPYQLASRITVWTLASQGPTGLGASNTLYHPTNGILSRGRIIVHSDGVRE